jgi:hypothetical protein
MNGRTAKLIRKFTKILKLKNDNDVKRVWYSGNAEERSILRKEMQRAVGAG